MADWFPSFLSELKTLITTTWTDVTAAQIFTGNQAMDVKLIDLLRGLLNDSGGSAINPPIAIIRVGDFIPEEDLSAHGDEGRMPCEIWWIDIQRTRAGSVDNQTFAHGKCFTLRAAIEANTATYFGAIERGRIDSSDTNGGNGALDDQNMVSIAAVLKYQPGLQVGESV